MKDGFDLQQAMVEAGRCLLCHDAPCSKGCPAGTEPALFIRKLRFKNVKGAIRTIKNNNLLGWACGTLCPSARLCEKECCATGLGTPIKIAKIQRALIEHSWNIGFNPLERRNIGKVKIAVIGSGPAGLTCAGALAKDGCSVTVFEERREAGGILRYGVPEDRCPKNLLTKELNEIRALGVEFKHNVKIKGDSGIDKLFKDGYKAIFLATGLWKAVRSKDNSKCTEGLFTSVDFLEALRDQRSNEIKQYIKDKIVAVIGGGSTAIDCAESAVKFGAKDVYVIYRRSYKEMPAEKDELVNALDAGIHLLPLNQPIDYIAGDNGRLTAVKLIRTSLGGKDSSGRRTPVKVEGSEWTLAVDLVVEAIGNQEADDVPLKGKLSALPKGVFAGGDIVRGPSLVVNAVKDGKAAAESIKKFLNNCGEEL